MAIERYSEGGELERRVALKVAAKKAVKHAAKKAPAKKHAAKKHAAKKHAAKHAQEEARPLRQGDSAAALSKAFHHMQRAAAVISLLDETGGDLRMLLGHGMRVYEIASSSQGRASASAALGLLRAAEHLSLCGLAMARAEHRPKLSAPGESDVLNRLVGARKRLEALTPAKDEAVRWLAGLAAGLVRRGLAEEDAHLAWEYAATAEGICTALETGL